jgi:DNA-directed RNA polymerase specialized sigma24 family protein
VKRDEVSWELTARLYLEGFSLTEVSSLAHVSPTAVRNRLQKQGIPLRRPGAASGGGPRLPASEIDKTVFLYVNMDLSAHEVGQTLGLATSTVMYRLRKAGVHVRTRREQGLLAWRKRCLAHSATE